MKIAIYNNKNCSLSKNCFDTLTKELNTVGIDYYLYQGNSFLPNTDIVIVIGGDGSILKVAEQAADSDIKILGINTGRIGFLTETERVEDIHFAVKCIKAQEYTVEKRVMLEVVYNNVSYYALNEVVVSRADSLNIVNISLTTEGEVLEKYNGDGIIVATPTGSTAYSLSAGGPVLAPSVNALLVTPICPHTMHSRSIVLPRNSTVTVVAKLRGQGVIVIDGKMKATFDNEGQVQVKLSDMYSSFLRFGRSSFYSKLLSKLSQWSDI